MNVDQMESEEFPMSPEIIAREQKKETNLKEVIRNQTSSQRELWKYLQ
jgi:hypothetical protein